MEQFLKSSFRSLYELEAKINRLYDEAALSCNMEVLNQASLFQEQLERSGFYSIDTHIAQVVSGLGLVSIGLSRPLKDMSQGQRAKAVSYTHLDVYKRQTQTRGCHLHLCGFYP